MTTMREHWTKEATDKLVGRKIVETKYNQDPEFNIPILTIVLDDGTQLYPHADNEGNGPGALHGKLNNEFFILPTLR